MGNSFGLVVGVLFLCCVLWILSSYSEPHLPPSHPIISAREGNCSPLLQATWRNSLDVKKIALDGYEKCPSQAAILPVAGPGGANFIVLPASETQFVADKPNTVLNLRYVIIKRLLYRYTKADQFIISNAAHNKLSQRGAAEVCGR
jgi:hypothetical protein